jgi:hypothetical protein
MLDLMYIAGFFDGEGSVRISIRSGKGKGAAFGYFLTPHIDCSQKELNILEGIKQTLGMGYINKSKYGFAWIVSNRKDATKFIKIMADKVVLKRRHLELLARFISLRKSHGMYTKTTFLDALRIAEEIAHLNSKHAKRTIKRISKIRQEVSQSTYTPEERGKRISEKLKGRRFSKEAKMKMSEAAKKRVKELKRDYRGRFREM